MAHLCVLLLRSTDEPERAATALVAAHAAAKSGRPAALYLASEGARLAARGVAETISSAGRPDARAEIDGFLAAKGRLLVSRACWRERGFADDALLPGATLVDPAALSDLAAEGFSFASF
jgi:predicted peroxiredoxin